MLLRYTWHMVFAVTIHLAPEVSRRVEYSEVGVREMVIGMELKNELYVSRVTLKQSLLRKCWQPN